MDEEQIPYDDPDLRRAYQWGWEAWLQGTTRPERQRVPNGKSAKAWLEGYIAAEDTGDVEEESGSDDVADAGDAAQDCAVEDDSVEDGTTYAKDADDTEERTDTENTGSDELDLSGPNPYGKEEARRREAWTEGYRAGHRGEALTRPDSDAHDDLQVMRARVEGYQAALEQREKD